MWQSTAFQTLLTVKETLFFLYSVVVLGAAASAFFRGCVFALFACFSSLGSLGFHFPQWTFCFLLNLAHCFHWNRRFLVVSYELDMSDRTLWYPADFVCFTLGSRALSQLIFASSVHILPQSTVVPTDSKTKNDNPLWTQKSYGRIPLVDNISHIITELIMNDGDPQPERSNCKILIETVQD